jgi:radical SAM-linked protein
MAQRLRIRFTKLGKVRFTSHRDVARMWERALRRSGLAVARSQGFNPRPLLSFGLALPTGAESLAEYLDVALVPGELAVPDEKTGPELDDLVGRFTGLLPEGIDATAVALLDDRAGSLQQEVTSCSWELEVLCVTASELARRVEHLLGAPSVSVRRERKGRNFDDDLRPSVRSLALAEPREGDPAPGGSPVRLQAELATRPRGVRPRELVEALGVDLVIARARRTQQWIERDGARWEPLTADDHVRAVIAPHAMERAS